MKRSSVERCIQNIGEQLRNIGIVNATKLNPNQPPHSKILKAYCKDHQIMKDLSYVSIKVCNSLTEELIITTSCNIPPSIQCENCADFGHKAKSLNYACNQKTVCLKCSSFEHKTEQCRSKIPSCFNCCGAHEVRNRQLCSYFKEYRKNEIKTKSKMQRRRQIQKDHLAKYVATKKTWTL